MDIVNIIYIINILLYSSLAVLAFQKIKRSKAHFRFFFVLLSSLGWNILIFLEYQTFFKNESISLLNRLDYAVAPIVAYAFLIFALHFPKQNKFLTIVKESLLFIPVVIFIYISIFTSYLFKPIGRNILEYNKLVYTIYLIILILYFLILGAGTLIRKYARSKGLERLQLKYLLSGFLISCITALGASAYQAFFGFQSELVFNLVVNVTIIFAIFSTYAMVRYRLMNIRLALRRGTIYTVTAVIIFGIYTALVFFARGFFETEAFKNRLILNFIAIIIIAIGFEPLRRGVRKVIDTWFFPERKKLEKALAEIKSELPKTVDLEKFAQTATNEISKIIPVQKIQFFLLDKKEGIYHLIFPESEKDKIKFRLDHIMIKYILNKKEIIVREELAIMSEGKSQVEKEEIDKIDEEMEKYNLAVAIPLGYERPNGILFLATKPNKDAYTSDDLKFLEDLKNQASFALDNAIMYKEAVERIKVE